MATSLPGPSAARAQLVDNVERQPPCSADSLAAFPDERLPDAHLGDTFVKREPICPANDDPFAFRMKPHATVGTEPDLSSVPFAPALARTRVVQSRRVTLRRPRLPRSKRHCTQQRHSPYKSCWKRHARSLVLKRETLTPLSHVSRAAFAYIFLSTAVIQTA
ncbi:hypothetical protein HPB50_006260 [Hyalomma asiaticum]|uniref:Uncharacterized protein n=1 Tax=Hyalomma asiaticum TaxID=266040 RepID=A0ACB7RUK2_HYAAI|nr:hypothetical protein HPB50_006260 [Hyalomma asiaticum]